ncbi:hypothetical protein L917_13262 [Phytophthora nicotianae]|uniref:HAT C-terminal dimerisation domain-containing protein n=2 Tax=Phytophthora nicotianae TaxID=4792 RepID=V9EPB2_PHYNI|nr:hypothetical protein F443_13914 [Phytophthora nicotianae P1569]ETL87579.1 hypothetical protein L917_13262 [Phytophthora nicotianae]
MEAVAAPGDVRPTPLVEEQPPAPSAFFSEDLMEIFVDVIDDEPTEPERVQDLNSARVDEELESWETNSCSIQTNASRPETMLEFWMRQAKTGAYKYLPLVARVLFAISSSSTQIERDFGIAGQLVTSQRGSIAPQNVEMSAFLNCDRQFVDVTQCPKIHPRDIDKFIPSNVKVGMEEDDAEGCELLSGYFSSVDDEDIDDTVT